MISTPIHYAYGAALIACAAFGLVKQGEVWVLKATSAQQVVRIAKLEGDNATLQAANGICIASVEDQNQAITDLVDAAEQRRKEAAAALAAAEQSASKRIAAAEALQSRPMPKPGDECGSLEVLINEKISERNQ